MARKNITDLQVLLALEKWKQDNRGPWAYETLAAETGECEKVCYRAMERAYDRGLLDYGVSLRTAWITQKGHDLLQANKELSHP